MDKLRLFVWGCGKLFKNRIQDKYIVGYIDSDSEKQNKLYMGKLVIAPEDIKKYDGEYDYILIGAPTKENEIMEQAKIEGISEKRILSSNIFFSPVEVWFNERFKKYFENKNVKIIKEWHYEKGYKTFIFSVSGKIGNKLKLLIMPYGCLGEKISTHDICLCEISGIENKTYYKGKIDGKILNIEIPVESENEILKFSISGMESCMIHTSFEIGKLNEAIGEISNIKTRNTFYNEINNHIENKYHEKDYTVLDKFSKEENYIILDIGANIGQSAMTFLSITNMDVISFEPHPKYIEPLNVTAKLFGKERMQIVNKGVGSYKGEVIFYIPKFEKDITQEASFSKDHVIRRVQKLFPDKKVEKEDIEEIRVPITSVDDVLVNKNKEVFFVKIDAENFELDVIKGMENVIKQDAPLILLEYNSIVQQECIWEYINTLHKYKIMYWDYVSGKFVDTDTKGSINYFLVPEEGCIHEKLKRQGCLNVK